MKKRKRLIYIVAGPLLGFTVALALPDVFLIQAKVALGVVVLMLFWWITRPVHLAITALIPLVVNAFFEMIPMGNMLGDYFNPIVLLIFGASILTATWSIHGLDKRIALKSLSIMGMSVNKQVLIFFIISLFMSAFMPNMVVVAALCPIAYSMVMYAGLNQKSTSLYALLISIAWGAGLGGFATPMGGAMNLVVISNLEGYTGTEFLYWEWIVHSIPYIAVLSVAVVIYLLAIKKDTKQLPGSRSFYLEQFKKIGRISKNETGALILFSLAIVISFARPFYQEILPGLKPPFVFLLLGVVAFYIRFEKGIPLIDWKQATEKINWGLIILFAGGIAVGGLIVDTGAAATLAEVINSSGRMTVFWLIPAVVALGMFLANTSSNTAACAVSIPLVISVASGLNINPIFLVFITAAACNSAYALPTSIRAVPVGYGLDTGYMFKKGMLAIIISFVVLVLSGYIAYMLVS